MDYEPFKVSYTAGQPYVGATLSMYPAPGGTHLGNFIAWDAGKGKIVWSNPEQFSVWSGALATAGDVVFYGTLEGYLKAVDAKTGKELYKFKTPSGIIGNINTYEHNGKQYIAVLVGWGGGFAALGGRTSVANGWAYGVQTRRLVAFSLDGGQTLPPQPPPGPSKPVEIAQFEVNADLAEQGWGEYASRCLACHGLDAVSPGMAPDLRASALLGSAEAFADVVRDGSRQRNGMPRYKHLSDEQLLKIRHYVRREAERALEAAPE